MPQSLIWYTYCSCIWTIALTSYTQDYVFAAFMGTKFWLIGMVAIMFFQEQLPE